MREEDQLRALPLFLGRRDFLLWKRSELITRPQKLAIRPSNDTNILDFVFVKVGYVVDDHPWEGASEVEDLVKYKGHDTRSKDIILQVRIPGSPETLKHVQVDIVFGDLIKMGQVGFRRG